jgi:hypothetical protein
MWVMPCNPKNIFFTTEDTESTENNKNNDLFLCALCGLFFCYLQQNFRWKELIVNVTCELELKIRIVK